MSDDREADRRAWAPLTVLERAKVIINLPWPLGATRMRLTRIAGACTITQNA